MSYCQEIIWGYFFIGAPCIYTLIQNNLAVNFVQQLLQILTNFDNICTELTRNELYTLQ